MKRIACFGLLFSVALVAAFYWSQPTKAKPPMGVFFIDKFSGAAGSLTTSTPELDAASAGWVLDSGAWTLNGSGELAASGAQPALPRWLATTDTGLANGRVSVRVKYSADSACGAAFRVVDGNNLWIATLHESDNTIKLFKRVSGTFTTVGSVSVTINPDTYYWIEVLFNGTTITVWLDGVQVITTTDSAHSTATKHGLRDGAGLGTFANFSIYDVESVGFTFIVAGQSNAAGRGDNLQSYSHQGLKSKMFPESDVLGNLADPTDTNNSSFGTAWPLLGTLIAAHQCVPCTFVTTAESGTYLSTNDEDWKKGGTNYNISIGQVADFNRNSSIVAMLWHQGEADANNGSGVTRAAHAAAMSQMLDDYQTDTGLASLPMIAGQIGEKANQGTETAAEVDAVRLAISDAWNSDSDIYAGPVMYDLDLSDGVHFKTNTELAIFAGRWWLAIEDALYGGSNGRGPRLSSAVADGATVTLAFDRDLDTDDTTYTSSAFAVSDGTGTTRTISSVERTGARTVVITCSGTLDGSGRTVSLASFNTGAGATVPKTAPIALPATINSVSEVALPAEPFVGYSITMPSSGGVATGRTIARPIARAIARTISRSICG